VLLLHRKLAVRVPCGTSATTAPLPPRSLPRYIPLSLLARGLCAVSWKRFRRRGGAGGHGGV
jgi:hypothetical protein